MLRKEKLPVSPSVPQSLGFGAAVLVCGEPFLTDSRWNLFLSQTKSKNPAEISVQTFYLGESDMDAILSQARSLPFLVSSQVFRLKEAEKLKDLEAFERYLEKPSEHTALFFEAVSLAKDSALAKLISKKGSVQFLEPSRESRESGAGFIKQKLKNSEKVLAPGVLARLEDMGQVSPSFMDSFLEKLILYAGPRREITEDMVETFNEKLEEADVFQLTHALFGSQPGQALLVLKKLLGEDEKELIPLLGFLHWQVRRLWQAKVLLSDGMQEQEVLRRCKVYPKQAPFFVRQVKQLKRECLEKALEGLFEIDRKLKTGQFDGGLGLELWIVEFGR